MCIETAFQHFHFTILKSVESFASNECVDVNTNITSTSNIYVDVNANTTFKRRINAVVARQGAIDKTSTCAIDGASANNDNNHS